MTAATTPTKARAIKTRGLMFTESMVKAINKGRKHQTRRLIDPQPINRVVLADDHNWYDADGIKPGRLLCSPYQVGDRPYVKESVIQIGHERTGKNGQYLWPKITATFTEDIARVWFTNTCRYEADLQDGDPIYAEPHGRLNKMFMPRWAARTVLEITKVRAERIQDISTSDIRSEGVEIPPTDCFSDINTASKLRVQFQKLWEKLHGKGSWALNLWVFANSFKRIEGGL